MADVGGIQPVGAMTQAPNVMGTLNDILGLQQKQQQLQVQGQQLQQQEMVTKQQQGLQEFAQNFDVFDAKDPNTGLISMDRALNSDAYKNSGSAKPLAFQMLTKMKDGETANAQSLLNLTKDQLVTGQSILTGLGQDPRVQQGTQEGLDLVKSYIPVLGKIFGNGAQGVLQSMNAGLDHMKPEDLPRALRTNQLMLMNAQSQVEAQKPTASPVLTKEGIKFVNTNTNAANPVGEQIPGSSTLQPGIQPGIQTAPNQQLVSNAPSGAISPVSAPPNVNLTEPERLARAAAATGISTRVQQAQEQANNTVQAQDALQRAFTIVDNKEGPTTGGFSQHVKDLRNAMASLGIDSKDTDDMNTLTKNLARYEATRATAVGLGHTDAARELAHNGSPNISLDKSALHGIITQSLATEKATSAYAKVQSKFTSDPAKMQQNEAEFRSIPNLIESYEYGLARNPQEAQAFLDKHGLTKEQMATTRQRVKQFENQ
jgi:hypothetical protein